MEVKDIVALASGGLITLVILIYLVSNQKSKIIEWLKYAVVEAEKMLGSGTGQLKLRQVYDWFCTKFPTTATVMPFAVFSSWVDVALDTMHQWTSENKKVFDYIDLDGNGGDKS